MRFLAFTGMKIGAVILAAACGLGPQNALAQTTPERFVAFGDLGYARTWDDEGLLGAGAGITGGFGVRLTERLTVQLVVDRFGYHRDEDSFTFDGRVIFTGVEAAFSSAERRVRGFWSIGGGFFTDDGTAIWKSAPERFDRAFTLAAMTVSGGVEAPVSRHASVRVGVRFHGLLDTGDDAAPHTSIQPTIGMSWRW